VDLKLRPPTEQQCCMRLTFYCLWICTNENFHVELTSSGFCCFHLQMSTLRDRVLSCRFTAVCLFCTFNHQSLKLWTINMTPDTFWHIIHFILTLIFLTLSANFMFSHFRISTESCDNVRQWSDNFVSWLWQYFTKPHGFWQRNMFLSLAPSLATIKPWQYKLVIHCADHIINMLQD
jgi:hypothetical protein